MENCLFNNEEQAIMMDLEGLPESEKIGTLEDSLTQEADASGRRVLRSLLSKLKEASRGDCDLTYWRALQASGHLPIFTNRS